MPVERSPVIPRLVVQMRANVANGVLSTQRQLAEDLRIGQGRASEILTDAIGRGLVERSPSLAPSSPRSLTVYVLTAAGRQYADEQMQGAGP